MKLAVVGHVEWVEFARVEHVPAAGRDRARARDLGGGRRGRRGRRRPAREPQRLGAASSPRSAATSTVAARASSSTARGVTVHVGAAEEPQRRAFTYVDGDGERTITVLGRKLVPSGDDATLPWEELARCDAVYFVSGDVAALAGGAARARARRDVARAADAPPRRASSSTSSSAAARTTASATTPASSTRRRGVVVTTSGALGGWVRPGGPFRAAPLPGPVEDAYGCGDCFAAGLTYALADGRSLDDAVALAARCGAAVLTGRGAYAGQLTAATV